METYRCKDCYYYMNGYCGMLGKKSVRPGNYCSYWISEKTGNHYTAETIIRGIREEKKK